MFVKPRCIATKLIKNKIEIIKVIAFTGRNSVFKERLMKRGQGRADDTKEVINHRFEVYKRETEDAGVGTTHNAKRMCTENPQIAVLLGKRHLELCANFGEIS